jgi:hypothetical protein
VTPTTKARALALGLGAMFGVFGGVIGLVALYALILTRDPSLIVGVLLSGAGAFLGWVILFRAAVDFTANQTGLTLGFVRGRASVPWSDVRGWTYLSTTGWEMLDLPNPHPGKYEAKAILTLLRYRSRSGNRFAVMCLPGLRPLDGPIRDSRTSLDELCPTITSTLDQHGPKGSSR